MIDVIDVDDELAGVADEEGEHQEDEDAGKLRLSTVVRVSLLKRNRSIFLLVCIVWICTLYGPLFRLLLFLAFSTTQLLSSILRQRINDNIKNTSTENINNLSLVQKHSQIKLKGNNIDKNALRMRNFLVDAISQA